MNWINLNNEDQFRDLLTDQQIFAVFKHSTRCSVSSMVKNRLERDWSDKDIPVYYLDLIAHRNVSNLIADVSGVRHESPQLIVFNNGAAVYDASHTGIIAEEAGAFLDARL